METESRQPWRQQQREREGTEGGRKSETLVPGAWAEACGRWCQNSALRACGQTKIKGAGAVNGITRTCMRTHD